MVSISDNSLSTPSKALRKCVLPLCANCIVFNIDIFFSYYIALVAQLVERSPRELESRMLWVRIPPRAALFSFKKVVGSSFSFKKVVLDAVVLLAFPLFFLSISR